MCVYVAFGGAKGIRTPDLLNAIQTRYQLRHNPGKSDLCINYTVSAGFCQENIPMICTVSEIKVTAFVNERF